MEHSLNNRAPGSILDTLLCVSRGDALYMLSCYLDDSDNDKGPVIVIAGYVGKPEDFKQFELEAFELFSEFGVNVLHTMKFHHGRGIFKYWSRAKKNDFVEKLYQIVYSCNLMGVCSSVNKRDFKKYLKPHKSFSAMSPLGHAFGKMLWGMRLKLPVEDKLPLSMIVESGIKITEIL